jgi:lipoprotein-releasing system ATP-binding protein
VAIARALMNQPSLILADEPTGNLDRASAEQVLDLMREINREEASTFLICTHDEHVAARCSRCITLVDGCVS